LQRGSAQIWQTATAQKQDAAAKHLSDLLLRAHDGKAREVITLF
jgi:hypothetical protein